MAAGFALRWQRVTRPGSRFRIYEPGWGDSFGRGLLAGLHSCCAVERSSCFIMFRTRGPQARAAAPAPASGRAAVDQEIAVFVF